MLSTARSPRRGCHHSIEGSRRLSLHGHVMKSPHFCRPEAYRLFAESLEALDTTAGLVQAALSVSLHALEDYPLVRVEEQLDALAARVAARARRTSAEARLAHLHHVLYVEEGFAGDHSSYYNPLNSYLPAVLESRRGIPITLALIYKAVAERVDLEVEGVNAPGHFLLRVRDSRGWLIIDPYNQGVMYTEEEAFDLIDRTFGRVIERNYSLSAPTTHAQWIERILLNLQNNFSRQGSFTDHGAMLELQRLLGSA